MSARRCTGAVLLSASAHALPKSHGVAGHTRDPDDPRGAGERLVKAHITASRRELGDA